MQTSYALLSTYLPALLPALRGLARFGAAQLAHLPRPGAPSLAAERAGASA
jgi:hypothetical protein